MKVATLACVAFVVLVKSTSAEPVGKCPRDMKPEGVEYLVDSEDNAVFYKCVLGMPVKNVCADGLHFSKKLNKCDLPKISDRKGGHHSSSSSSSSSSESGSGENPGGSGKKCPTSDPCPLVNGEFPVYFRHPETCTRFCQCDWGVAYDMACPDGLHFNTKLNVCDWPESAGCEGSGGTPPTSGEGCGGSSSESGSSEETKPTQPPKPPTSGGSSGSSSSESGSSEETKPTQPPKPPTTTQPPKPSTSTKPPKPPTSGGSSSSSSSESGSSEEAKPTQPPKPPTTTQPPKPSTSTKPPKPPTSGGSSSSSSSESGSGSSGSSSSESGENGGGSGKKCPTSDPCPSVNGQFPVYFRHPETCTRFCQCDWGVAYDMPCPDGLHFNTKLNVCDWPAAAGCA